MKNDLLNKTLEIKERIFLNESSLEKCNSNTKIYNTLTEQIEKDKKELVEIEKVWENPQKYGYEIHE